MTNLMQPNYVLENNRTPVTHFIEVWQRRLSINNQSRKPMPIDQLDFQIDDLTVAIFKIHPKCKN